MSTEPTTTGPEFENESTEETLRRERDELQERLLRTAAEFDNYRKRTDRERRELVHAAAADLIEEILPVVDDLERALAAPVDSGGGSEAADRYRSGVELIRRQLLEVLKRHGVEALDVIGQDFDPTWHESIGYEPANGRREGEVTSELRRGYRLGDRLLRPAMVRVAKA